MKKERRLEMSRRDFLGAAAGSALTLGVKGAGTASTGTSGDMPYRALGRTGEKVSLVGLGGFHLGKIHDEKESIRIVRTAIDNGITFMDNAWDYNGGASEERMGKALRDGYRDKVFLMTKIDGRDRKTAQQQLNESLKRLRTDRIDLLHFHEVIRMSEPDRIFAPGGALECVTRARQEGKVRFIGFTGHKSPDIHLKMLETARSHGFTFDALLMPLNVMDAHYNSFQKKVLPVALERGIGVMSMKPFGDPFILDSKAAGAVECLHYVMNLPTSVVITGIDSMPILDQALHAARTFKPLSESAVADLLARTSKAAGEGKWELYKTTEHFDSTERNPQWLG